MGVELITERYEDQIAGVLSCYDRIIIQGDGARLVLRGRDDRLLLQAPAPDLRLPRLGPAVARGAARKHGGSRRRKWDRDRVCAQQEELSERRPGQRDSAAARRAFRRGVHSFGYGAVRQLPTLA